ncbi:non-heme iron oxygenase ferredoxin subunit [Nesterenkonia populi]|uniref:non-heme iron oxygenase ferredoxin subunit n=1 Tax=Nesterenkonia populi TaxID=1591087 RepID=UPI0011BF8AF0|nr:non-heme iron oxygenase ferredoxin subunit [Nesterenkonia populi]
MADKVALGPADQLPAGEVMLAKADDTGYGEDIAVVHALEGGYYGLDDECSHEAVPLSDGFVEDGVLECPMHASGFCLKTGVPETPPALEPVKTHLVTEEDGTLYLHPGVPHPESGQD